jgi:hypothetical protein
VPETLVSGSIHCLRGGNGNHGKTRHLAPHPCPNCPDPNHFMAKNRPDCPEFVGDLVNQTA